MDMAIVKEKVRQAGGYERNRLRRGRAVIKHCVVIHNIGVGWNKPYISSIFYNL